VPLDTCLLMGDPGPHSPIMQPLWKPAQPQREQCQLIPPGSFFLFLTSAFWKNYLLRIAFGATIDSAEYEKSLHGVSRAWQPLDERTYG
jgi:hypothetical protein